MRPSPTAGRVWYGCLLCTLGLCASPSRAELLYFAQGGQVQMPATVAGSVVRLETPDGPVEFDRTDFRKIVPGSWPEQEWEARRQAALAGDSSARFAAAWWALENGLTPQAEAMLRALHAADPPHQPTARLVATLDRLDQPCSDPDLEAFRNALGRHFEEDRGPHVLLLHQHEPAEARQRIDVLERVIRTYYLLFAAQGLDLPVPRRRLASAWFAEQADYQAFLRAQNAGVFESTRGYYHPTLRAVVAFDARSTGPQKKAGEIISARRLELNRLAGAIARLTPNARLHVESPGEPTRTLTRAEAKGQLLRWEHEVARRQVLLDTDRRAIDLGTAAHEMVHQLVAESRLIPRHDAFPSWLHEGFAAQFEVIRGGRWAGISRAHDLRLPDWRAISPPPHLLAVLRDDGFGHGYRRDVYAQSWALVYHLRKNHPDLFLSYLDLLRTPGRAPDERVAVFQSVFGSDLDAFERDWRRFIGSVLTPLEEKDMSEDSPKTRKNN